MVSHGIERRAAMPLSELLDAYRPGGDMETWEDAERVVSEAICLCCGQPGHYQQMLEAHIAEHGLTEGIYVGEDGRLRDGHHRITAARRLGIEMIPLESKEDAGARWVRDHGYVDWRHRRVGDVPDYATLDWCLGVH